MKRLLNGVKTILEYALGFLLVIFAYVFAFIFYAIDTMPLLYTIPVSIVCIGAFILGILEAVEMDWRFWLAMTFGIICFISIIYDCYYRIKFKKQSNCRKRLRLKLTDEFQEMQIRYSGSKKDLAKIALEKLPYVFKARIISGTIEYQLETKDGEIIYRGTTTDCLWFEKNVYL